VTRALGTAGPTRSRRRGGGRRCHRRPPRHGCGRRRGDAPPQPATTRDSCSAAAASAERNRAPDPGGGGKRRQPRCYLREVGGLSRAGAAKHADGIGIGAHAVRTRWGAGSSERVFGRRHELGRVIV
jgi:hypothetical protein